MGVKTGVTTNGTYLNEEIVKKLETVTVSQMNISLQTPDAESFKTRKARRMEFDEYQQKILEFIAACLKQKEPPKIKMHFLNTTIQTDVPGEDWSLGTMKVINNTQELRNTFTYWANELHKISPPSSDQARTEVLDKIQKLSAFKWNVVQVVPNVYFETYILDTWGNAFVGDNVVPSKVGYCSLTDHFAIQCNGNLSYCCKDFDGKTTAGNVLKTPSSIF